jgi:hypothetical protein
MIPSENKNTIHFKQILLPNCLPHDLDIVTVNGGGEHKSIPHTHRYCQVYREAEKNQSGYFIATPCIDGGTSLEYFGYHLVCRQLVGLLAQRIGQIGQMVWEPTATRIRPCEFRKSWKQSTNIPHKISEIKKIHLSIMTTMFCPYHR